MSEKRKNQMQETELLSAAADKFGIYQLKDTPELNRLRVTGDMVIKTGRDLERTCGGGCDQARKL